MHQLLAIENEKGCAGDKPSAAEKILDLDDAGNVTRVSDFFKSPFVVSTKTRDDDNGKQLRI